MLKEDAGDSYDDEGAEAIIPGGYVYLAKRIADSSLMAMPANAFKIAIYVLACARHEPRKFYCRFSGREFQIQRGELITTTRKIAEGTHLSHREARTGLEQLLGHGFVADITVSAVKSANGYTHLKVLKYEHYQTQDNYFRQRTTNERPTYIGKRRKYKDLSPKKEMSDSSSPTHRVMGFFYDSVKALTGGRDVPAAFSVDGKIVKDLLHLYGEEETKALIGRYVSGDQVRFYGPSLPGFRKAIPKLLMRAETQTIPFSERNYHEGVSHGGRNF